jgi:hypothetical protein
VRACDGAGAYVVRGSVDPERAGEALKVLRESVASLRRGEGFVTPSCARAGA